MSKRWVTIFFALVLLLVAVFAYREFESKEINYQPDETLIEPPVNKSAAAENYGADTAIEDEMEGVNPIFTDKLKMQKGWIDRGKSIAVNNFPGADDAKFNKTYFHRGFKNTAVTCGEVQFIKEGIVIADYQRFIFPGLQTTYYENNIENFDILWDKLCSQLYE